MQKINELQLAKELIRFPTVTPVDAGVMKFLEKKLKSLGFKTKILEFKEKGFKPVKNLYARLGSKGPNFLSFFSKNFITPASNGVTVGNLISSLANCNSFKGFILIS